MMSYFEKIGFVGHLVDDVGRGEDGIQVEPLRLHQQPFFNRLLDPQ